MSLKINPNLEDALDRVERNANEEWKQAAREALDRVMVEMEEFTSEDVFAAIPEEITTHELRAMGPIMRKAIGEKTITPIGVGRSKKPGSHSYYTRIYRATYKIKEDEAQ